MKKIKNYLKKKLISVKVFLNLNKVIKPDLDEKRAVYFDLKSEYEYGRYLINWIYFFYKKKYRVVLKFRSSLISNSGWYEFMMVKSLKIFLALKKPDSTIYCFSDDDLDCNSIQIGRNDYKKTRYQKEVFRIPYSMHPMVYLNNLGDNFSTPVDPLEKIKYKIVFAGSLNSQEYKDVEINGVKYISRCKIIDGLISKYKDFVFVPKSKKEFINGSAKEICIISRSNFSLTHQEYFHFLRNSHFSICPPGVQRPLCHNLIESMYQSVIPILQYPDHLQPHLKNNSECLVYSDLNTFFKAIDAAFQMEEHQIKLMRKNVSNYYNKFLQPDSVIENFEKAVRSGIKKVLIHPTDRIFGTQIKGKL